MRLDKIHATLDFISEKERSGFFSPEQKDIALDTASMELFNADLPMYGTSEKSQENLAPFKRQYIVTNTNSPAGLITMPDECEYITGLMKQGYDNVKQMATFEPFEIVNDDELPGCLKSQLRPPSIEKPVAQRIGSKGLLLYPNVANACRVFYLKRPDAPRFAYTQPDRDPIYDDVNSVQLEWNETNVFKIIYRALSLLGVHLDEPTLMSYAKMKTESNP